MPKGRASNGTATHREPRAATAEPARRSKVQSAATAVAVLKALAAMGGSASLTGLAARLQESPAKVHRYLATLVEEELVLQEAGSARYVLGPETIAIGLAALRQSDVLALAAAELARLAEAHELSCFVAVLGNQGPTIIRWVEPTQAVTVNVKVGSVMPVLWSATGRAFGAFCRSATLETRIEAELARATPAQRRLVPDRQAAEALFAEIRAAGCAPVRDVLLDGVSAVAAPVFDMEGKVPAVITALGPTGSFDPQPGSRNARLVREAADAVSLRMGATPKPAGAG